ncbi:MAG: (deoxy)nucleoside triphosphate pyrophosphohydrolase [Limisphaerales bacterium]
MPARPPVEVAAALVFRDGRLLIAQRPPGKHLAGLWEFPGGKREPDETWEACLRREIREELDCDVEVGECLAEIGHDYPEKSVLLRFHVCRLQDGEPRAVGCAAVAWVTREGLARHEFPPADAALLARLQAMPWPDAPPADRP